MIWAAVMLVAAFVGLVFMIGYGVGHDKAMRFHEELNRRN